MVPSPPVEGLQAFSFGGNLVELKSQEPTTQNYFYELYTVDGKLR
jgi:hypothetical protein